MRPERISPDEHNEEAGQLGAYLVDAGQLARRDLERALRAQRDHPEPLGTILVKLGLISEDALARGYAEMLSLPLLKTGDYPDRPEIPENVSREFLRRARLVPLEADDQSLLLAMADPTDDYAAASMRHATGKEIRRAVGIERDITAAFERLERLDVGEQSETEEEQPFTFAAFDDVEKLRDLASEAPVIKMVNSIIDRAMTARASDIHIEPGENGLGLRYRIDGLLRDVGPPPAEFAPAIVSRIKIMAGLDIAERRRPQDGRVRFRLHGQAVDLRVSTVPTLFGESIAIRILEEEPVKLNFRALGFPAGTEDKIESLLSRHHGILLVTGPTGSGKTTTQYAAMRHLRSVERKIISIEDPVEYQLGGVTQIQVNPQIGLTFASILRSIVRQDPDIIMIGEMRDTETAQIAVQSALTGHLVLSSLHTNDAAGAVTRLLDMGVEDYLVTSSVNGILAQRLVRTLCGQCRERYEVPPELVKRLRLSEIAGDTASIHLYRAVGCEACSDEGYRGRTGIYEFLEMTPALRDLILGHADTEAIRQNALRAGMTTMFEDGLRKALDGQTTIEEISRVTRDY